MRPFDAASPWNTPLSSNPVIHPSSSGYINQLTKSATVLTADPDQYTIPVYFTTGTTPQRVVTGLGYYSTYRSGEASRVGAGSPWSVQVPIPGNAVGGSGSDGQIAIWDQSRGMLYEFWQFTAHADGSYTASNGWQTYTGTGYMGRFADGKAGRGAGTPYLAGLVTRADFVAKAIKHAIAFAYHSPSNQYVHPAGKSDGRGVSADMPEGTRLQLNPYASTTNPFDFAIKPQAYTLFDMIVTALKTYGMIVVDNSGSAKLYLEHRHTADWGAEIDRHLVEAIPLSAFRVVIA